MKLHKSYVKVKAWNRATEQLIIKVYLIKILHFYKCMYPHFCLQHIELLKQFLDTNTVHVADNMKTGVCNKQQRNLVRATERAIEEG